MGNRTSKDVLSKLQEIMHSKPNLMSLCGIADDTTEAVLSGINMSADDAIILASELCDKGALSTLDLSNNRILSRESGKALANALAGNTTLIELDLSNNQNSLGSMDGAGFTQELTVGIKGMKTLSKLSLQGNKIPAGAEADELSSTCEARRIDLLLWELPLVPVQRTRSLEEEEEAIEFPEYWEVDTSRGMPAVGERDPRSFRIAD
jgi:hypothetical protein